MPTRMTFLSLTALVFLSCKDDNKESLWETRIEADNVEVLFAGQELAKVQNSSGNNYVLISGQGDDFIRVVKRDGDDDFTEIQIMLKNQSGDLVAYYLGEDGELKKVEAEEEVGGE